jgi:tRNA(His) 5'-end guanylyltransferase
MGSDKTALGDRMKWYESRFTNDQFMPMVPVIARMDGRAFHTFTAGLARPYDERLSVLMTKTTEFLVKETDARCGYTQSDEITLVWLASEWESEIFFAGKLQKMNSILAAMTTAFFNKNLSAHIPEKQDQMPLFDSRVFQVPTDWEATNCFIWREMDATRNSVQMAARSQFSHGVCENKDTSQLQELLWSQKGINWNNYPNFFKRGTYVRRRVLERPFNKNELEALPPKHAARQNPGLIVKRTVVMPEDFPPLARIANREDVILHGADPVLKAETEPAEEEKA